MKRLRLPVLAAVALALFVVDAEAQKKPTKKAPTRKTVRTIPPLDVRAAREKVDVQLGNVNVFVERYGPVAQALETLDNAYATRRPSVASASAHENNKRRIVTSLSNLKAGLEMLESEFRTKPALAKYRVMIQGIAQFAADSEDLAIAGKFVQAKDPLREVARKLTDTRAMMPM